MTSRLSTLLVAVLVCVACRDTFAVRAPAHWRKAGNPPRHANLSVSFAVKQPGAAAMSTTCTQVSDPASESYGQYLSLLEVANMLGAGPNLDTVTEWLRGVGADNIAPTATLDFVTADFSVTEAEAAFGVRLHEYHLQTPTPSRRAAQDTVVCFRSEAPITGIPPRVAAAVDVVLGITDFPPLYEHHRGPRRRTSELEATTPPSSAPAPDVSFNYVASASARYVLTQVCPATGKTTNATIPCSETTTPVTKYQSACNYNARVPTDIPWSHVDLQCSVSEHGCSYLVTIPHTYSSGDYVNCSIRAVFGGATSAWSALPWKDVPPSEQGMVATPIIEPHGLYSFYGLPKPSPVPGVTQAVAAFNGNYYSPADLKAFYSKFDVPVTGSLTQHGPNNPAAPGAEGTLDIEWLTTSAPSVDTTYWYQQGNLTTRRGSFVLGLATAVSSDPSPPDLISISYGGTESFYTKYIGPTYIPRCNVEFQKMCARGITVLAAAGDAGSCNASPDCTIGAFFPGSSPWVTAVSATFTSRHAPPRPNPSAKGVGEAAVSVLDGMAWTTGGGFSAEPTCEQPWYQKAAVAEYLARQPAGMPPASMYNASLRAYPDVSALGHNIITVTDGITQPADGTSAATPIFAGIISRLNQARKARGLAVIGFANPLLYAAREKAPSAFYDIVGPTNNRCGNYACCPYGFEVTPGFDAVTGLGSVGNFTALEEFAVLSASSPSS